MLEDGDGLMNENLAYTLIQQRSNMDELALAALSPVERHATVETLGALWRAGLFGLQLTEKQGKGSLSFAWSSKTFDVLAFRLAPLLGQIVDGLTDLKIGDECPVKCVAGRYLASDSCNPINSGHGLSGSACGRGYTRADAAFGCIAEAAERFCLARQGNQATVFASADELRGLSISPSALQLFSASQYENRKEWNLRYPNEHHVPSKLDADAPTHWVKPSAALSTSCLYVPLEHCLFDGEGRQAKGFPPVDSSGCAVGANLEDAAVRGFLELVERDAVSIWWYGRIRRQSVPIDVWSDPMVSRMRDWCSSAGRQLFLLDLTTDLEIPVVAAISCDQSNSKIAMGFGAAANFSAAATSALGEMIQFQINLGLAEHSASGSESRNMLSSSWHLLAWSLRTSMTEDSYLRPDAGNDCHTHHMNKTFPTLDDCHDICRKNCLELLAIDMTRKELDVPVARVVVPGLRSIWPRFASGRLYDVPIAQGWRESTYAENDVNATPILY
jgi:oxazoline/thiazoline synthase